jgi:Type II secretion system (T2SS), protein M subtype b
MKRSRTLIITIPLMAVLLGFAAYKYGFVQVRSELTSLKDEQAVKGKLLEKYVALISEKPELEKKIASLKEERKADDSKLIEGQTPSLAAAALQDIVKGIVTARGGTISSERVGKQDDLGHFRVINVSVDTVLPDVRVLGDILYSLETRTPYLVIKEMDTRIRNYNDPRELMVKLDVSAITSAK